MTSNLDQKLGIHAFHVRKLFGLLCQIYSGGKGIEDLGEAMVAAAVTFEDLAQSLDELKNGPVTERWEAHEKAIEKVKGAISIGEDRGGGSSFAENKITITKEAAKLVAHILLDNPGRGSKAATALLQTCCEVGSYHASRSHL